MRVFITFCALWLGCVSLNAGTGDYIVGCYWGSWSVNRTGDGDVEVSDLDPTLCTHIFYAFIGLSYDGEVSILKPPINLSENEGKGSIEKFIGLRNQSSTTKMMVSMGGWDEGSEKYSAVIGNSTLRSTLVKSILDFLECYGFDGLDLDWEYPNQRGGVETDIEDFVSLLKELRERFDEYGYILSIAVAAAKSSASLSYDIPRIAKYVDFINLMTYDFHGSWDTTAEHNTPLYVASRETTESERNLNINASVHYWLEQGMPAEKIILGTAAYGHSFNLTSTDKTAPGSPVNGAGLPGPYTQEAGVLSYLEILQLLSEGNWTTVWDEEQCVPYAYLDNQWISYDNVRSITEKAEFVKSMGLGGAMMWSLESDDPKGTYGTPYPILKTINDALCSDN